MRRDFSTWFANLAHRRTRRSRRANRPNAFRRRLAIENLEPRQMLAAYTVDSLLDNTTADAYTTLREAIVAAADGDTIEFDTSLTEEGPATIELSQSLGQLTIADDVTIAGPGRDLLTIDAQGNSRVFMINTDVSATISDLTITGGSSDGGGGIYTFGDLTLDSVRLNGNSSSGNAGGIFVYGTLNLNSSIVSANEAAGAGGGIYINDSAYVTIRDSTVDSNEAYYGAGIFGYLNDGERLLVESSTISNNRAVGTWSTGGGMLIQSASASEACSATIVNSTISRNSASYSGGIRLMYSESNLDMVNSTVAFNQGDEAGGFEFIGSTATIQNTIIAENTNAAGDTDKDVLGSFDSASSYNLLGRGGSGGLTGGTNENIVLTIGQSAGLAPLGINGGPTRTHALLVGSPALDAGNVNLAVDPNGAPLEGDQRDHRRPFDLPDVDNVAAGGVDIGAFEAGNPTPLVVNTLDDELDDITDHNFDYNDLSLREALEIAQWQAGGEQIDLSNIFGTIYLKMGELTVNARDAGSIDIIGSGSDNLTINAHDLIINPQNNSRVFRVDPGTNTTIAALTITGGNTTGNGGGIISEGNLTLSSTVVTGNHADLGGGIYSTGNLSVENSRITANQADSKGGGIYQIDGTIAISDSQIDHNSTASTWGTAGGLYVFRVTSLDINSSTIEENDAGYAAGMCFFAPFGVAVAATIRNSTIANNTAYRWAGGLYLPIYGDAALDVINTTISNNTAVIQGGGLQVENGGTGAGLHFINATIAENGVTTGTGGGIYVPAGMSQGQIRLDNTIIAENLASGAENDIYGVVNVDSSHNLIGPDGYGGLTAGGSNQNIILAPGESAGLSPLGNYGGPTETHALMPTSPAIDAGDDAIMAAADLAFDQLGEGFDRKLGDHVDIGANEAHVIQHDGTIEVYGTEFDDEISITNNQVTIDRLGNLAINTSLADEIHVDALDGNDEVSVDGSVILPVDLKGGNGDDVIHGGGGDDNIAGGDGNDTLNGGGGDDSIDGGFGDDQFPVGPGDSASNDSYSDPDQDPSVTDQQENVNHPPTIQPLANRVINAGSLLQFQILANDTDEPTSNLQFSFVGSNYGATLSSSGNFSWTPAWSTAEETEFTFRVQVRDTGIPQLQDTVEFSITVVPASPSNVRFAFGGGTFSTYVRWDRVEGADGYYVERKVSGGWQQVANLTATPQLTQQYVINGTFTFEMSYRIRAYKTSGEVTPFSNPLTDYFTIRSDGYLVYQSNSGSAHTLSWEKSFEPSIVEYIIERLHSSDEGWVEIARVPSGPSNLTYTDNTGISGETYRYAITAYNGEFRGVRSYPVIGSPTTTDAVDLTFADSGSMFNTPQIRMALSGI